ncbi:MAG: hypothetical protein EOP84_10720 [Verrucomicrobiaceae bacterium]|nr:MAG: hypothetical protein EOP84_10720 [Verrucomicrobiaceae bacterium]
MRFETQARIPFRVVGDRLMDFYTGEPLDLGDGTVGDVVVDRALVGSTTARLLSREEKRTIAPKGTRVLIYLSKAEHDRERLIVHYHPSVHRSIGSPFHAQAILESDLAILLRGTKKTRLGSKCSEAAV